MPLFETKTLLADLQKEVAQMITFVEEELLSLEDYALNHKPSPKNWSAYECIEHLNLAHEFYMIQIKKAIAGSNELVQGKHFNPGFFGNQMVNTLKPTVHGEIKTPMPTFTKADPSKVKSPLSKKVIEQFLKQLHEVQGVLSKSLQISWEKVKITSLMGRILRFKFGDALRFVVAHNQRHLLQAQHAIETYRK